MSQLIDVFQGERQEQALVTDGKEIVGLATTTDAFEAIAGDLRDPLEEEKTHPEKYRATASAEQRTQGSVQSSTTSATSGR